MKMIFPILSEPIDFTLSDKINVLTIENPSYFTHFLTELYMGTQKYNSEIVVSENNDLLPLHKCIEVISTFIPFDINRKTLLTKLYNTAEETMKNEDFYSKTNDMIAYNVNFLNDILQNLPYSIDISPDFDISYLLKAVNMRFSDDAVSIAEKTLNYMETVNTLEGNKCFVLVNIRNYIDEQYIDIFYKNILYRNITVLLVNANDYPLSQYEKKIIVDKDLCVI